MVVADKKLKERVVYVYPPSMETTKEWKRKAEEHGVSLSKFVIEHVMNSLRQEEGEENFKSRIDIIKQNQEKDKDIRSLMEENRILRQAYERLDIELKRYRTQPFLEEEFQGVRTYDKELMNLLRTDKVVDSDHLLEKLGVDSKESDLVKAVNRQLENLEAYGLIETTPRGWRWIE